MIGSKPESVLAMGQARIVVMILECIMLRITSTACARSGFFSTAKKTAFPLPKESTSHECGQHDLLSTLRWMSIW